MDGHEQTVEAAFDDQASAFGKRPVQSDPRLLEWLVNSADLPGDSLVLDAGCGPGLVAAALLAAGHRVVGVDLSAPMIRLAEERTRPFGARAQFERLSVFDPGLTGPFDAAVSRFVLHHMTDAAAFVRRLVELLRPGGILVLSDHTTDPRPDRARWQAELEAARDRSHVRNLSPGELVDCLAAAGLVDLRLTERPFGLDFDEWFDRGTPGEEKEAVRQRLRTGPDCRGFAVTLLGDGKVGIDGWAAVVRGVKPRSS